MHMCIGSFHGPHRAEGAHEDTNHAHVHRFLPRPAPRRGRVENDEDAARYARERDVEGGKVGETWPRTQPTPPLRGGSRSAAHERDGAKAVNT